MNDKLCRRSVLLSGLAVGVATRVGLHDPAAFAAGAGSAALGVQVTVEGQSYHFDEAKGRDLGDYEGPGFVQRCVLVTVSELPLSVFMRPDRDSDRVEVVFELGRVWSGPPRHLGAYSVEIERGGKLLAHVDVPKHYWFSRWRWQSARRPVVAKAADLIAAGLLPPFAADHSSLEPSERSAKPPFAKPEAAASAAASPARLPVPSTVTGDLRRGSDGQLEVTESQPMRTSAAPAPGIARRAAQTLMPPSGRQAAYSIMGLADLTAYMPTTGDRTDIGPVTEAQGRWICTAASGALEDMLAQAEASGTVPWNVRDEKTGAPFNFEQYPRGGLITAAPQMCDPYIPQLKSVVTPDEAHHPSLTYVPFLFTGDPYYLEALQLSLTWLIGSHAPAYRLEGQCILHYWQTRAYAWCLRDAAQAAKVTPKTVPGWLLPRSYWERILENNRIWFEEKFVRNPNPPFPVFHAATQIRDNSNGFGIEGRPTTIAPWEEDYLAFVIGWTASMFPAWREAFAWKAGATIARTDGKSGWVRAYATPYNFCLRRASADPWPQNWKEAWNINVSLHHWKVIDPDRWSPEKATAGYLLYTRAVLALATRFGVSGARECYDWADQAIRTSPQISAVYRWSVSALP